MNANEPPYLFIAKIKFKYQEERINALLKFPLVFRYHEIVNEEDAIGKFMYDCMVVNKVHAANCETKLICLLDTCGEYMIFSTYYLLLWLKFGFVITDILIVLTYTVHKSFNSFVSDYIQKIADKIEIIESSNFARTPIEVIKMLSLVKRIGSNTFYNSSKLQQIEFLGELIETNDSCAFSKLSVLV